MVFVNLKPIVPGHVLVTPRRVVERVADMTPEEAADLFLTARFMSRFLLHFYSRDVPPDATQEAHPEGAREGATGGAQEGATGGAQEGATGGVEPGWVGAAPGVAGKGPATSVNFGLQDGREAGQTVWVCYSHRI